LACIQRLLGTILAVQHQHKAANKLFTQSLEILQQRGLYHRQAQAIVDRVQRRYETDQTFRSIVERYLADFEKMLQDLSQSDPRGGALQASVKLPPDRELCVRIYRPPCGADLCMFAIVSDIHANLEALTTVLNEITIGSKYGSAWNRAAFGGTILHTRSCLGWSPMMS